MKRKEKELFKALCDFKSYDFDEQLLEYATPKVLGHLFFNRMAGVAYGTLKNHKLLGKVNREFSNSLKCAYESNIKQNKSFFKCVKYIDRILTESDCNYALLKGAYLCKVYPEGYRTSNDIDVLVNPKDVTKVGNALLKAGFRQGNIKNGIFIPATRKEIIESKMMRGETIPYIKELNLPNMHFLEIDLNFSLDYKPNNALLNEMLNTVQIQKIGSVQIRTLSTENFFIHLCAHLYKEASTYPWIQMSRDMTLYKYSDIYLIISSLNEEKTKGLFEYAKNIGMSKICAYATIQMCNLFNCNNLVAKELSETELSSDPDFLHMVFSPADKKNYIFIEKRIDKRFFADNRSKLLKEVGHNE